MNMNFNPSPGIAIVQPLTQEKPQGMQLTQESKTRLVKGKVLAMGINLITDANALLEAERYAKVGDTVYFLSYEGDYDNFWEGNKKYYAVKWQDMRTVI